MREGECEMFHDNTLVALAGMCGGDEKFPHDGKVTPCYGSVATHCRGVRGCLWNCQDILMTIQMCLYTAVQFISSRRRISFSDVDEHVVRRSGRTC